MVPPKGLPLVEQKKIKRYEALDGLRGVAAMFVVFYHVRWTNHLTDTNAVRHCFLFVDLFFMLSGFVLASSYLGKITCFMEIRHFLWLRFFRIYPLHAVVLVGLVGIELAKYFALRTGLFIPAHIPFAEPN